MNFRQTFLYMLFLIIQNLSIAQTDYTDYSSMIRKCENLSKEYPSLCKTHIIAKTPGGKDIIAITIGSGNRENKPGLALFGGVSGKHILGRELAAGFASAILKESASADIKNLLDKVTFYILPDVNPDATAQFFAALKYERNGNSRSSDDDRDFITDEDGYEDLDANGFITLIRVEDPAGQYVKSSEDERVMVKADPSKGEQGKYLVYSEGIDNDNDGEFNEDGPGEVDFNRNFTFDYEPYGKFAGLYPVSEQETKAVADFLFDRYNIYAVLIFGPQDNLGQPLKAETGSDDKRIPRSVMKEDEQINTLVSNKYREITGLKGSPPTVKTKGNFMDWAYFHYGRYSFSTPAWWFPADKDKNGEAAFLKFAEDKKIGDVFIPWKKINHAGFQGKLTEAGGIKPFAMTNPPPEALDSLIRNNYKFITSVALMHPELEFLDIVMDNAGQDIFRITLKVHNRGIFATCAKIGEENMWTRIMKMNISLSEGQHLISGKKVNNIRRLEGGESEEFSWLISGKGPVTLSAGALNTGIVTKTIELK